MKFAQNDVVQTTRDISGTFDISGVELPWSVPIGTMGVVVIVYANFEDHYEIEIVNPDGSPRFFFNARADQLKEIKP